MAKFKDVINQATNFVQEQKGVWDHIKLTDLINDIQNKGTKLNKEMQDSLGSILESIKKIYFTTADDISDNIGGSAEKTMSNITNQTTKFIEETRGMWDLTDWERFIKDIQKKGIKITEDTKNYIDEVLVSARKFYNSLSITAKKQEEEKPVTKEQGMEQVKTALSKERIPSTNKKA